MSSGNDTDEQPESTGADDESLQLEDVRMGFLDHLGELRRRIIYSLIGLVVAFGICWFFRTEIYHFLQLPLIDAAQKAATDEAVANLHQQDLTEVFFALLKSSLLAAAFLASPVILYQIWKFVAPGLYPDEKKAVVPFITMGTVFFFIGGAFCYSLVIPYGYHFLFEFSAEYADPVLMIDDYFSLTFKLLLAFGIVFELPVVTYFLSSIGILTHRMLLDQWRIAIVVAFILGAMLTPPEVMTQALLAGPMIVLYFLSVLIAWFQTRRREKNNE